MTRQAPSAGFVALCITAVVAIVACGNASQAGQAVGGGRPSAWGPLPVDVGDPGGTASGQVTFTPNTVVITASQVRDSLTGVSADGSTYTFSSDSGPLGDLAPGKVMLLESLDAARVTSVNHDGSTLVVNTSPISLSDLIQSGSIDESGPPDLSGAFASEAGADTTSQSTATLPPGATSSASATATQSAARTGVRGGPVELTAFSGSGYTYSNKSGDLAYSITLTGGADGIHAVGGFCFSSDGSGSVTGTCSGDNVYLKGDLTGLLSWQSQSAKMTMAKGQPSKGSLSMSGLSAQLTVTYVALRGKAGQIASKLPAFEIPFTFEMPVCPAPTFCAGVPLYMKVQLSVLITLGISAENASMQGGFSAVVAGSGSAVDQTGFTVIAGSQSGFHLSGKFLPGPSVTLGASGAEVGFRLKVSLGLGIKNINALLYIAFIAAIGQVTGSLVARETCQNYYASFTINGGIDLQFWIFKTSTPSVQLFYKEVKMTRPGC